MIDTEQLEEDMAEHSSYIGRLLKRTTQQRKDINELREQLDKLAEDILEEEEDTDSAEAAG